MKCPKCGADMVIKKKENDNSVSLIFCSACSNTIWLKSNIREIEVTNIPCNEVSFIYTIMTKNKLLKL